MHPGYTIGSVYLHRDPIDFRKQINGLAALVQGELELSPFILKKAVASPVNLSLAVSQG